MTASLIALFAALRVSLRSRLDLEAEILALRHQLAESLPEIRNRLSPLQIWAEG